MEKRVFILTGVPGSGKTTVLEKTVKALKIRGISVGGVVSQEVRECGIRVGFEIFDLATGKHGWLAHVGQKSGPKVGRYHVNMNDLESVGAQAIANALANADVVAIDEIGPMELFSEQFKVATGKALGGDKLVLAVVHFKEHDRLVVESKARADAEVFIVTERNRIELPDVLVEKALAFLG